MKEQAMHNYRLIIFGAATSIIVYIFTTVFDLDLFERLVHVLEKFEGYELDEVLIACSIFALFVIIDVIKKQKQHKIEIEKIKIYKAMLSSTHHILNNFLNQMQLFKMSAEDTKDFPADVLDLYDQIMEEASSKIDALGAITNIDATSILSSVAPGSHPQSNT